MPSLPSQGYGRKTELGRVYGAAQRRLDLEEAEEAAAAVAAALQAELAAAKAVAEAAAALAADADEEGYKLEDVVETEVSSRTAGALTGLRSIMEASRAHDATPFGAQAALHGGGTYGAAPFNGAAAVEEAVEQAVAGEEQALLAAPPPPPPTPAVAQWEVDAEAESELPAAAAEEAPVGGFLEVLDWQERLQHDNPSERAAAARRLQQRRSALAAAMREPARCHPPPPVPAEAVLGVLAEVGVDSAHKAVVSAQDCVCVCSRRLPMRVR